MLREAGRGFSCATDENLRGPPTQTARHLLSADAVLFTEPTRTSCTSNLETTTWKKETLFFLPSSQVIYLSRCKVILVSGKVLPYLLSSGSANSKITADILGCDASLRFLLFFFML
jgi:hypothetical protein